MSKTMYRFLFPCWDAEKREWCVFAAQPMGNVYVAGGFSLREQAAEYVEESAEYEDPNAKWRSPPSPVVPAPAHEKE